jgi:hypothetical protein
MELQRRIRELREAPARWWAGEAEVVRAYFSLPRTAASDARWLKLQAARELGAALRAARAAPKLFEAVEDAVDRHDLENAARGMYEEVRHYRLLADILEEITGEKPRATELLAYAGTLTNAKERVGHPELPALTEHIAIVKGLHNQYGDLTAAVLSFFEGGGAAIFHSASKVLEYPYISYSNGVIERKIAAAMQIIYEDEMRHGLIHIPEVAERLTSEADFQAAHEIIDAKAKAHLRLRNETFGYPLSETRMREIDAGIGVESLTIDYQKITPISPYSA